MSHEHCDKCFLNNCLNSSSCPFIYCPHGCFARMHECKRVDHEYICPNIFISCVNINYGCPLTIRRCDLSQHLRICPASIIKNSKKNQNLIETIAYRDNIWYEHITEYEKKQKLSSELNKNKRNKQNQIEHIIRSEKYHYITMPECMLSKGNGVICSTCRKHLRQLEENEDQRLSELTEEERKMMSDFNLHYSHSSDERLTPSLVKMSSTLINSNDILLSNSPNSLSHSDDEYSEDQPMPIISDIELPSSQIYRLNYFASNKSEENLKIFHKSPRFFCHALCRRDEIEQHWNIHFRIDCILNTALIQQCPKSQYGCTFQYECIEPCQNTGQTIKINFDKHNDAMAFEWYPDITENNNNNQSSLLDLPSEIIEKILLKLDSLSLRNISLVCRRLRNLCQDILPSRGIVITEYERNSLSHGEITWVERKKHWLFTNTSSAIPKWQLKTPNKLTSLNQHLITCSYGEIKDLQKEPPFPLLAWAGSDVALKHIE